MILIYKTQYDIKMDTVIFGYHTYKSIGPFHNCTNIILSNHHYEDICSNNNVFVYKNVKDIFLNHKNIKQFFVMSGIETFVSLLSYNVFQEVICPSFFKYLFDKMECDVNEYDHYNIKFTLKNRDELNFVELLENIMNKGIYKPSRNVSTKSLFGEKLYFSLQNDTFPLITTKKTNLKHIFEELMFFLSGKTDTSLLEEKGVNVWSSNTSRAFLDSRNLQHYPEKDMGPSYSFQFRHFGAEYSTCKDVYTNGYDQLQQVIHLLKTDKFSRRIIINLWNASDIDKMALPPCGMMYQFIVTPNNELETILYQRSSDIALAGAWNIASASLFTYLLANITGLEPRGLTWMIGDVHLYENQFIEFKKYLSVQPKLFPKLYILNKKENIIDYSYGDLKLVNYEPHPFFKIPFNT